MTKTYSKDDLHTRGITRIFLIGYMGAGKSETAKALAELYDCNSLDMDAFIEANAGMSIRQIFMKFGEHEFRNREAALLDQLCAASPKADSSKTDSAKAAGFKGGSSGGEADLLRKDDLLIVACGGGIILDDLNRDVLKKHVVVFLDCDAETMFQRVRNDDNRPNAFLDITDDDTRLHEFTQRYRQRYAHYVETALVHVNVGEKTPRQLADEIAEALLEEAV